MKFDNTIYRRILTASEEIKFEPINKYNFNPSISSFTEFGIKIKLNFDHLKAFGISGQAIWDLEILEPSIFKSKLMMTSMTKESIFGGKSKIEGEVPA